MTRNNDHPKKPTVRTKLPKMDGRYIVNPKNHGISTNGWFGDPRTLQRYLGTTWNPKHPVLNGCLVKKPLFTERFGIAFINGCFTFQEFKL